MTLDYVLKAIAILVIAWGVLNIILPSKLTRVNTMVLSSAVFAVVIAVFTAVGLIAACLLYPKALTFTRFAGLLLLLAPASILSAFLLEFEKPTVNVLEQLGMRRIWPRPDLRSSTVSSPPFYCCSSRASCPVSNWHRGRH